MPLYIGLMSGTSMDGIDAALVELDGNRCTLIASHCAPLKQPLKERLERLCNQPHLAIQQLGELDIELGRLFAQAALSLIEKSGVDAAAITAIGSHGQTIFHAPGGPHPFSLQLGDPNTIAELTGITTVADFRQRDIAAGGEGAPLVPAFHEALFRSPDKNRVIINIGGIANITILPRHSERTSSGFDTGPGNTLMDAWSRQHIAQPFDSNGEWAQNNRIDNALLERLLDDPYFELPPPKSTGREYFNLEWLRERLRDETPPGEVQRTLLALTVESIAKAVERYAAETETLFICGGGAQNRFLMEQLRERLPHQSVNTTELLGTPPDWVEAVAFAWLAKQRLEGKPASLPSATGARHRTILGGIYAAGVR